MAKTIIKMSYDELKTAYAQELEKHRALWAKTMKKSGHYSEPFYVQLFINEAGEVKTSVHHAGMVEDVFYITDAYDN